ncbi:hypothetical protein J3F83DRAFT_312610 [Trichoderma novae-zelandiae]
MALHPCSHSQGRTADVKKGPPARLALTCCSPLLWLILSRLPKRSDGEARLQVCDTCTGFPSFEPGEGTEPTRLALRLAGQREQVRGRNTAGPDAELSRQWALEASLREVAQVYLCLSTTTSSHQPRQVAGTLMYRVQSRSRCHAIWRKPHRCTVGVLRR